MKKIKIRTKYLFITMGSCCSLMLIALVFSYVSFSNHYRNEFKSWTNPLAEKIIEEVKPALIAGNQDAVRVFLLKYLQKEPEITYLVIVDNSGNVFTHSFEERLPFVLEDISLQKQYAIKEVNINGFLAFDITYPIKRWTLHMGFMRLTQLSIEERVLHMFKHMVRVLGLACLFGVGLAFFVANIVFKPVRTFIQAAETVSHGDLDTRVEVKTKDELGELASVFNEMTENLKSNQEEIKILLNKFRQIYNHAPSPIRVIDTEFNIISQNEAMNELVGVSPEEALTRKCYELLRCTSICHTKDCSMRLILKGIKMVGREKDFITQEEKTVCFRQLNTAYRDSRKNIIGIIAVYIDISDKREFIKSLETERQKLVDALKLQQTFSDILTFLGETMGVKPLLRGFLEKIAHYTNSQLGIIFLLEDEHLEAYATSALDLKTIRKFKIGDGLPGRCAVERRQIIISDVPGDYFKIYSGSGEYLPNHIVCTPILYKDKLIGVLELGALHNFGKREIFFLDIVTRQLGIGIDHAMIYEKAEKLAAELQEKNEILVSQNEELQSQSEELITLNEELQTQTEELTAQQKAIEEKTKQVEEADRLKSEFLSIMSHELRTPLNAVKGMTELLHEKIIDNNQKEYLKVIERNSQTLLALINDVLDLSKIEAGKLEVIWEKVYLNEFIEELVASVRALTDEKNLSLKVFLDESIDYIVTDPEKLKQVLINLLSNAIKFTDRGEVAIEVKGEEERISISVKDTGIGISEDALNHIFEAFRQVNGSTTRRYGGTGLGLSIANKLVLLLRGDVKVESKKGSGSTFTVILPRQPEREEVEEEAKERIKSTLLVGRPLSTKKVLIIDDDPVAIRELSISLKDEPHQLMFASNGEEGLDCIRKERPDLILLDLKMPVMDGFALLDALEEEEELKDIPVVILSELDLIKEEKERLSDNVKEILLKGIIDKNAFIETVKRVLYGKEAVSREKIEPLKILIAEDNPDSLFLLKEILKDTDYLIYTVENGVEAIQRALEIRPNLILLDMLMPVMDGYEVTKKTRAMKELKNIPIIALTAKAMKGDREEVLSAGCNDYITKPVNKAELLIKIEDWIKREVSDQ